MQRILWAVFKSNQITSMFSGFVMILASNAAGLEVVSIVFAHAMYASSLR